MACPSSSYLRARAAVNSQKASCRQEEDGSKMTQSTSRIPSRFHARLEWIGRKSVWGWSTIDETWQELWELQEEITPYIESEGDERGTARK